MSTDELENYEADQELQLYREYRDVVGLFTYVVETDRRFYLANTVDLKAHEAGTDVYFELTLKDAWAFSVPPLSKAVRPIGNRHPQIREIS